MSSVVISGNTSGSVTLDAPAVAGSTTYTLVNVSGTLAPLVSGTAIATTSGTSHDFTGIPSWVKRITVMFNGVSTNGSSVYQLRIGDSGGVETSGYIGAIQSTGGTTNFSVGVSLLGTATSASVVFSGAVVITCIDVATNTWVFNGSVGRSDSNQASFLGGAKALSATLDRVSITTVNGTDAFDAGSINIMYE